MVVSFKAVHTTNFKTGTKLNLNEVFPSGSLFCNYQVYFECMFRGAKGPSCAKLLPSVTPWSEEGQVRLSF